MADNTRIDMKRLWEMAQSGKSAQEIMKELDITDMDDLKRALDGLMQEKGETVAVAGLTGEPGLRSTYTADGIRIPPAMLEGTGFKSGDMFDVKVEGNAITLKKASREDPTMP
jgi:hypothetical protein